MGKSRKRAQTFAFFYPQAFRKEDSLQQTKIDMFCHEDEYSISTGFVKRG